MINFKNVQSSKVWDTPTFADLSNTFAIRIIFAFSPNIVIREILKHI